MTRWPVVAAAATLALVAPAQSLAHGHPASVALGYQLTLKRSTLARQGVDVRVVAGDRELALSVARGVEVTVRGDLGEPMLRIDAGGVWVNANSPTAASDRLVSAGQGWLHVSSGRSIVWRDDRLVPPPRSGIGADGRFAIPIDVNGHPELIAGTFTLLRAPAAWPWLTAAAVLLAGVYALSRRRAWRGMLTIGLGLLGGLAALVAVTAFAARNTPGGGVGWLQIASGVAIGAVCAGVFLGLRARSRVRAAGVIGALGAVASLSSLSVFWRAGVISLLPSTAARAACGLALVGGLAALTLSLVRERTASAPTAAR